MRIKSLLLISLFLVMPLVEAKKLPCIREVSTTLPKEYLFKALKKSLVANGFNIVPSDEDSLVGQIGNTRQYFTLLDGTLFLKSTFIFQAPTYYSSYFSTAFNSAPVEKDSTCSYINRREMPKFIEAMEVLKKQYENDNQYQETEQASTTAQ